MDEMTKTEITEPLTTGSASTACPGCGGEGHCSCGTPPSTRSIEFVYALGQLGIDFLLEARRDSIGEHMQGNPYDPAKLLAYIEANPWESASVMWTLNIESLPIYAVRPEGAFAGETYRRLREFLADQLNGRIERVAIGGVIAGQINLLSDITVPIVLPEIRSLASWRTEALVEAASAPAQGKGQAAAPDKAGLQNFLERVYYELRNRGRESSERAINYAATNAFNVARVFTEAVREQMELDSIEVESSPLCRPDSDCWDVKLTFFNPRRLTEQARRVYRFTVDVSDVCPVMIGKLRSWSVR